jgi:DNA repair photolyase
MAPVPSPHPHGRGTGLNPSGRFERLAVEPERDEGEDDCHRTVATEFFRDASRTVITRNESPDIPYTFSLNPYRGCEHGCVYCYARPYHEYLGFSAGLDFETKILIKEDAPELLRRELGAPNWRAEPIAFSGVTDPYQPVERRLRITRRCLEVLADCRQPVSLITKSGLVSRDGDLLAELARESAAHVTITITTLDEALRRSLEPRAASAGVRLASIAALARAGVPVGVMVSPVIPGLTDHEIPRILEAAVEAGAAFAGFTMVRFPHGVGQIFEAWLDRHAPGSRAKVLGRIRDVRGGGLTDPCFGSRMRGEGPLADLAASLFSVSRERVGLADSAAPLSGASFRHPARPGTLFDLR